MSSKHLVGITACPSGVAHTYLAAENLKEVARTLGFTMDVETHGQIGVEDELSPDAIARAEAVVIAADKKVDLGRFGGKRVVVASAGEGIHKADQLIERALASEPLPSGAAGASTSEAGSESGGVGQAIYKNLMNGVSHMIPFVVVGGLFLAFALAMYGQAGVPEGGPAKVVWDVGVLGLTLMVPILSGYIAYAIADRPGLAPGAITGMLATSPAIYGSEASAGFLGGIITGFASGYVALAIKKIPVHRHVQPVMPIIIIPVVTTLIVGGLFVYLLGGPIGGIYNGLTDWLASMTGVGMIGLGVILGLLTGFDLGGPVNKVAYVTTGALIAAGQYVPGAMNGVAVAVPPMGLALAVLIARKYFTEAERQNGIAAAAMGFFGITEGAIPFAAARPLQVIPASMIGAAAGAATAGALMVENRIWWGGPIVALLGGTSNPLLFILALAVGCCVTAGIAIGLIALSERRSSSKQSLAPAAVTLAAVEVDDFTPVSGGGGGLAVAERVAAITDYVTTETVVLDLKASTRDQAIKELVEIAARSGRISDVDDVVRSALARERQFSTAVGHGIAIPHAKTDGVDQPVVVFARNDRGIEWESPSGDPAQLLFLIAVPEAAAGDEHLEILARLSRALVKAPFREGLAAAKSEQQVLRLLGEYCN